MIRQAKLKDLVGINELMKLVNFVPISKEQLRDCVLVSVRDEKIVGFIWASVSKSKYLAFVDYLAVHPEAKGDGFRLCKAILKRLHFLGIKKILTNVKAEREWNALQSYRINVKIGLKPLENQFYVFYGDTERMSALWEL